MRKIRDIDQINEQATTDEKNFLYVVGGFLLLVVLFWLSEVVK